MQWFSRLVSTQGPLRLLHSVAGFKMALPNVVFVLGGPGAGKGTQCQNIVQQFGYVHLSAGDLLREERRKEGSEVGALIESHIKAGSIVPVEITCGLLENAMKENMKSDRYDFLIDGFPRNKDNLDGWNRQMGGKANLQFVLFFDCSEEVCVERCLHRGAAGSGRSDDNPDSLKRRIVTYNESTRPIIEHYDASSMVKKIDASGSPDQVFAEVKKLFTKS
ncbi:hypothetical protein CAPTEDRAFT_18710 [Capitella teleta]|uniref:UMP-CMP kinase n=1 Tax=Capitella teleta TaxID=283909 RepID=R7UBG0_CAPTE|nr:hypothetical protein CAPTEDRAFT_18710 [Capitella teleta]|eukprot:ELU03710.1 hypothetical protein CAPTEDRAFT_18710 [Capitella teleta]